MYVEPRVPYDQSKIWEVHNHYYKTAGNNAWEPGAVPYVATNNFAIVKQHANFLIDLYAEEIATGKLNPDDHFYVMEVGAGLGLFAANLFLILTEHCGEPGRHLVKKLHYILTDYDPKTVRAALENPRLAPWKEAVTPALFDLSSQTYTDLDGNKFSFKANIVYANYICCVSRTKQFHRKDGKWFERYAQVLRTEKEFNRNTQQVHVDKNVLRNLPLSLSWQTAHIDSATLKLLETFAGENEETVLNYPIDFLRFISWLAEQDNSPHLIISDFGIPSSERVTSQEQKQVFHYTNTLNHSVHFGLFDALSKFRNWSTLNTESPMKRTHHTYLKFHKELSSNLKKSFIKNYEESFDSEDLQVFWTLAQERFQKKDFATAAHLAGRCSILDPVDPAYPHLAARALIACGRKKAAELYISIGKKLPADPRYDFSLKTIAVTGGSVASFPSSLNRVKK